MGLEDTLGVLRRFWRGIVVIALLGTLAGAGALMLQKPTYTAAATVHFLPQPEGSAGQLAAAMEYASGQAKTFAELARTPVVLDPVIKKLGLSTSADALRNSVATGVPGEQAALGIWVSGGEPKQLADIANAVAAEVVNQFEQFKSEDALAALEVKVTQPATAPSQPVSPDIKRSLLVAAGFGLLLGVAQAFARAMLDRRIASSDDVAAVTSHEVLGEIPFQRDSAAEKGGSPGTGDAFSIRREAYRRLRTNLQFLMVEDGPKTFLVTSSIPGEGKTATAANLARALADAGEKVLLIDSDLRRPQIASHFGMENEAGLSTALLEGTPASDLIIQVTGIDVLPSGPHPETPSELLSGARMKQLMSEVTKTYDAVILDTPPVLPVTDATVLSQLAAGVLLVVDAQRTHRTQLRNAVRGLERVNANIVGIVLNKLTIGGGRYGQGYGYGYGYGYKYVETKSGKRKKRRVKQGKRSV